MFLLLKSLYNVGREPGISMFHCFLLCSTPISMVTWRQIAEWVDVIIVVVVEG